MSVQKQSTEKAPQEVVDRADQRLQFKKDKNFIEADQLREKIRTY